MRVLPIGAVTKGRAGKLLAELGELADAGCIGFSDDGSPVADASIMRHALEYASAFGLPVIDHCEDPQLAGGVMHEGWVSTRLGLKGIPSASEENMVSRDIALARQTRRARAHRARQHGGRGRAGAPGEGGGRARHGGGDAAPPGAEPRGRDAQQAAANAWPTTRTPRCTRRCAREEDVAACIEGLKDGTIDAIATDHAPHAVQEKLCEFDLAANGIMGLETALALSLSAPGDQAGARRRGADDRAGAGAGPRPPGAGDRDAVGGRAGRRRDLRPEAGVDG